MPGSADTAPALARLVDERDQLLRSIEDLDRELAEGELDEDDHAALRADYVAKAASVLRAIEAETQAIPDETTPASLLAGRPGTAGGDRRLERARRFLGRRGVRQVLEVGVVVCLVGLVTVLALRAAGVRLPGESSAGSVALNSAQQIRAELAQAQTLGASGDVSDALTVYQAVLTADPTQPEALAYRGWLIRLTGIAAHSPTIVAAGRASIEEALQVDPSYGDAHLFLGLTLYEDYHDSAAALTQFRAALRDDVSLPLVKAASGTIEKAFRSEHVAVPPAVSGA